MLTKLYLIYRDTNTGAVISEPPPLESREWPKLVRRETFLHEENDGTRLEFKIINVQKISDNGGDCIQEVRARQVVEL